MKPERTYSHVSATSTTASLFLSHMMAGPSHDN